MTTRKSSGPSLRARERAKAHARREHYCSCGKVVRGNGGKYHHKQKHLRLADGHRWLLREQWLAAKAVDRG